MSSCSSTALGSIRMVLETATQAMASATMHPKLPRPTTPFLERQMFRWALYSQVSRGRAEPPAVPAPGQCGQRVNPKDYFPCLLDLDSTIFPQPSAPESIHHKVSPVGATGYARTSRSAAISVRLKPCSPLLGWLCTTNKPTLSWTALPNVRAILLG